MGGGNPPKERHVTLKLDRNRTIQLIAAILACIGLLVWGSQSLTPLLATVHQQPAKAAQIVKKEPKKGNFDYSSVHQISLKDQLSAKKGPVIGQIYAPSVNMKLNIYKGLDYLASGACTMTADQKMGKGNYPLAGHYMTEKGILFEPIDRIPMGGLVYTTDGTYTYTYKIYFEKILSPKATWIISKSKLNILTLMTCADSGANRFVARGLLIKKSKDLSMWK